MRYGPFARSAGEHADIPAALAEQRRGGVDELLDPSGMGKDEAQDDESLLRAGRARPRGLDCADPWPAAAVRRSEIARGMARSAQPGGAETQTGRGRDRGRAPGGESPSLHGAARPLALTDITLSRWFWKAIDSPDAHVVSLEGSADLAQFRFRHSRQLSTAIDTANCGRDTTRPRERGTRQIALSARKGRTVLRLGLVTVFGRPETPFWLDTEVISPCRRREERRRRPGQYEAYIDARESDKPHASEMPAPSRRLELPTNQPPMCLASSARPSRDSVDTQTRQRRTIGLVKRKKFRICQPKRSVIWSRARSAKDCRRWGGQGSARGCDCGRGRPEAGSRTSSGLRERQAHAGEAIIGQRRPGER